MAYLFDDRFLPCPFCGNPAEWEYTDWDEETGTGDDGTGWVECTGCGVRMFGVDKEDAEQNWNTRAAGVPVDVY